MLLRKFLTIQIIFATVVCPVYAQGISTGLTLSKELSISNKGNEYVSGDYPGAVLMKVNLWGAVGKPGIHYIPTKTDLITLLSYAGGPHERAEMDDITIKRFVKGKQHVIKVDAEDLINGTDEKSPTLEANDIIVIPSRTPTISQNTMSTVGFVASILSIALAGFVLTKQLGK